jgi:hypothetical protein
MSGWHPGDKYMEENNWDEFPAVNNATVYGQMPADWVPAPSKYYSGYMIIDNSKIKKLGRSTHEEFKIIQKILQIYAIHSSLQ